jgi:hypothetical protein
VRVFLLLLGKKNSRGALNEAGENAKNRQGMKISPQKVIWKCLKIYFIFESLTDFVEFKLPKGVVHKGRLAAFV